MFNTLDKIFGRNKYDTKIISYGKSATVIDRDGTAGENPITVLAGKKSSNFTFFLIIVLEVIFFLAMIIFAVTRASR